MGRNIAYRYDIQSITAATPGWWSVWFTYLNQPTVELHKERVAVWGVVSYSEEREDITQVAGFYPGECGLDTDENKDQFLGYLYDGEDIEMFRNEAERHAKYLRSRDKRKEIG